MSCDPIGRCITCSDEGVQGRVLALRPNALADVELDGRIEEVAVELVEGLAVGDRVLVHAGVALVKLEPGHG